MSPKKSLAINTLILGLGRLSTQVVSFLLLPIYTAFLSPEEYGLYDLVVTYVSLLAPALILQIDRAGFRYLIEGRGDNAKITQAVSNTVLVVMSSILISLLLYSISLIFINTPNPVLIPAMLISSIAINLLFQIARGLGDNKTYAVSSLIVGLSLASLSIPALTVFDLGVAGIMASVAASNLIGAAYILVKLKVHRLIKPSTISTGTIKDLLKYSTPLVPSAISWWAVGASDRTIISIFLGVAANGIYAVSNRYAAIFMALYSIFDMSWTESASIHIDSKDRNTFFSSVYNNSLRLFGALGLIMIAGFPLVFNVLVGDGFKESYLYFPILILGGLMNSLVSSYSVVYIAKKLTSKVFRTAIVAAAVSIVLNLALIKFIGLYAAAISTVASYLAMAILRYIDIQKYVQFRYRPSLIVALLLSYAAISLIYYINSPTLNILNLILAVAIASTLNKNTLTSLRGRFIKNRSV